MNTPSGVVKDYTGSRVNLYNLERALLGDAGKSSFADFRECKTATCKSFAEICNSKLNDFISKNSLCLYLEFKIRPISCWTSTINFTTKHDGYLITLGPRKCSPDVLLYVGINFVYTKYKCSCSMIWMNFARRYIKQLLRDRIYYIAYNYKII